MRLWDLETGREVALIGDGHRGQIQGLAFAPNGTVVTAGTDNTVRVWDPATVRTLRRFGTRHPVGTMMLALVDGGGTVATADINSPLVLVHDLATGRELHALDLRTKVSALSASPDGAVLTAVGYSRDQGAEKGVNVDWEAATGREVRRIEYDHPGRMVFLPDGRRLMARSSGEEPTRRLEVSDFGTGRVLWSTPTSGSNCFALTSDGRTLAVGGWNEPIILWELASGRERLRFDMPAGLRGVDRIRFSPDGRWLVGVVWGDGPYCDGECLWDATTGQLVRRFAGHEGGPMALAFSKDGRSLATGGYDSTALIWDMAAIGTGRVAPPPTADLSALWGELATTDAAAAYRAVRRLIDVPDAAVALIRQRTKPVPAPDAARVAALIQQLDARDFKDWQAAAKLLDAIADPAADQLRTALAKSESADVRKSLQAILNRLDAGTPETLRAIRAVEVLEQIATPTAREHLTTLSSGAPGATLTRAAAEAVKRLGP
jgi:hypothetical protein